MRKKLRIISLCMLIAAIIFVILAFMSMGSTITLPLPVSTLHIIYRSYLVLMVLLFVISFFVKKS